MIQLYGPPRSSAGRCYLLLEELGLKYEQMPLDLRAKEHKSEKYLQLNPNGKVPCLVDDGFVIWESLAINFYLAEKYKPELLGRSLKEKGTVYQWSVWALVEMQPPMVEMLIQLIFTPEDKRDMKTIEEAKAQLPKFFAILDKELAGKDYFIPGFYSLADINVASVVNIAQGLQVSFADYRHLSAWFGRIKDRPAFQNFMDARKH